MNRTFTSKDGRYKFSEEEHVHTLDGNPLNGVTTVLKVIAKPALIQWAANMAVDYIEQHGNSPEALKEARVAHRKKKESAGDVGTEIHAAVEEIINAQMGTGRVYTPNTSNPIVEKAVKNFIQWMTENNVKFLESEKHVWSEKMWVGGILDMVFEMDGKKYIGDIKTSSGIYNEAFFQMAAYALCLEEMGEGQDIAGYLVINLKKDGKMDLKMATDLEVNKDAFKHALGLHKIINSIV